MQREILHCRKVNCARNRDSIDHRTFPSQNHVQEIPSSEIDNTVYLDNTDVRALLHRQRFSLKRTTRKIAPIILLYYVTAS